MVPMLLALYGHPDSGGIWEQHLNSRVVKQGWKQILPDIWHSIFHHQELNCLLVVYVDDFKMAGPAENLPKAWATVKAAVDIGEPEHTTGTLVACTKNSQTSDCQKKHIRLHSSSTPSHPLQLSTGTGLVGTRSGKQSMDSTSHPTP